MELLQKMVGGTPQFVRCIKPNDGKTPKTFEAAKVQKQLRCTGVLETIRIRQNGFSHRFTFAEFLKQYCILAFGFDEKVTANRDNCRLLLVRLKMDGWALGKSKVFLKYYHVEILVKLYDEQVHKVVLVQACVRRWLARIQCRRSRDERKTRSVLTLQRHVRGWLTRRHIKQLKEAKQRLKKEQEEKNLRERERLAKEQCKLSTSVAQYRVDNTIQYEITQSEMICSIGNESRLKGFLKARVVSEFQHPDSAIERKAQAAVIIQNRMVNIFTPFFNKRIVKSFYHIFYL